MRAAWVLVLAASCPELACYQTTSLPEPRLTNKTQAVLLIAHHDGDPPSIQALKIDPGQETRFPPLALRGDAELSLVEFRCSLEHLGLQAGLQELAVAPAKVDLLPQPIAVADLSANPGGEGAWSRGQLSEKTREALRRLPLEPSNLCRTRQATLVPSTVALPADRREDPAFAVVVDDDHILVASRDGVYYLVDRLGNVETRHDFGDDRFAGAYRAEDGELWLVDLSGKLVRGTLQDGFTVVTSSAPFGPAEQVSLDGPNHASGAPLELYAETDVRTFLRFDGTAWTLLASSPKYDDVFIARVAWIAPNEAAAISVGRAANTVVRYKNGEALDEVLDGQSGLSTIAVVPGFGTVIGRDDGGIYVDGPNGWTALSGGEARYYVRVVLGLGDGFLYGSSKEINFLEYRFAQYFADVGHCPAERLTEFPATHLARFGDGTILAATLPFFGDPLDVVLLNVESPPGACSDLRDVEVPDLSR